jgi:hypothetical protein
MLFRVGAVLALALVGCGDGPGERQSIEGFGDSPDSVTHPGSGAVPSATANATSETMAPSDDRVIAADPPALGPKSRTTLVDAGAAACWGEFACGGNLVGRWRVSAICADTQALVPDVTGCDDLVESIRYTPDDYVIEFTEDTWTSSGWLTTTEVMNYTDTCLSFILGHPAGVNEASCLGLAGSAASCEMMPNQCRCEVTKTVQVHEVNSYRVNNGQIVNGQAEPMDYCVQGDVLRIADGAHHLALTRLN